VLFVVLVGEPLLWCSIHPTSSSLEYLRVRCTSTCCYCRCTFTV